MQVFEEFKPVVFNVGAKFKGEGAVSYSSGSGQSLKKYNEIFFFV